MSLNVTGFNNELQSTPSPEHRSSHVGQRVIADARELEDTTIQSLPPYDSGRAAWSLLITAFVFEALLWGFPLSFGVFQNYYSRQPTFKDNTFVSIIGTTASGISYLAAPIAIPLVKRFSKYRRHMILVGWPTCLMGLVAGSFAKTIGALIFTQGIMYGVGFVIFYYPILSMVNEFWFTRRGMAYGLLCSASGFSGAVMPFCLKLILEKYGYPTTLRAVALGLFLLTGPLIPLLKGRIPDSHSDTGGRTDWTFLREPLFWIYSASNFAMSLGYFFPSLYLPSYAASNGLPSTQGALLLALMSTSQVFGQFSFGYLSDRDLSVNLLTATATLVAAVSTYACWGLAQNLELLVIFSIVYGFFGTGYTATWARMCTKVTRDPTAAFAAFGLFNFGKGVGNVISGPIGGMLVAKTVDLSAYGAAKYESVILFTGTCMLVSAAAVGVSYIRLLPR